MKFSKAALFKKIWYKIIPPITMMVLTSILLTYVSYSWIRREWSPRIEQSGITIATGNTLTFVFDTEDGKYVEQSILDLIGDPNFKLKSVSNLTGRSEDFFCLEPDPNATVEQMVGVQYYKLYNIRTKHPSSEDRDTRLGAEYGYVDVKFTVQAPNNDGYKRYIYIDNESFLSVAEGADERVLSAIRISVTLSDPGGNDRGITYLFGYEEKVHRAINNDRVSGGNDYALHGERRYADELDENGNPQELTTIEKSNGDRYSLVKDGGTLYTFDSFCGDKDDIENTTLFPLENGQTKIITVRIWAEGEDPMCTSTIAGKDFNMLLKFSALIIKGTEGD